MLCTECCIYVVACCVRVLHVWGVDCVFECLSVHVSCMSCVLRCVLCDCVLMRVCVCSMLRATC